MIKAILFSGFLCNFLLLANDLNMLYNWQRNIQLISNIDWVVVGAGPAGISAVGLLLDAGVDPTNIAWIDPEFNVGRLGKYYTNVPSNTKTKLFIEFLQACKSFNQCKHDAIERLYKADPEQEYALALIVDALAAITSYLRTLVHPIKNKLTALDFSNDNWHVSTQNCIIQTKHVILATGAEPRRLDYPCPHEIPLDEALDKNRLKTFIDTNDTIAVVGSAHSAILLLKYLTELPVARIINFYKHPLKYPTPLEGWILYEGSGLKGETAYWAKTVLEAIHRQTCCEFLIAQKHYKHGYLSAIKLFMPVVLCDNSCHLSMAIQLYMTPTIAVLA